jgi:RNA polymerase sigma factor (sigma-70 family)
MGEDFRPWDRDAEKALVERALMGDRMAWQELFKALRAYLRPKAVQLLKDEHDAEELVQETIEIVFRQLCRFRGDASVLTWAMSIAINNGLKQSSRNRDHRQTLDTHDGEPPGMGEPPIDPERWTAAREAVAALARALPCLNERDQLLVTETLNDNDSEDARMPADSSAMRVARHRARQQLRALMDRREDR